MVGRVGTTASLLTHLVSRELWLLLRNGCGCWLWLNSGLWLRINLCGGNQLGLLVCSWLWIHNASACGCWVWLWGFNGCLVRLDTETDSSSTSLTVKEDPSTHKAKLMYSASIQHELPRGINSRISSSNPFQNPSMSDTLSHWLGWLMPTNSSMKSPMSPFPWKKKKKTRGSTQVKKSTFL